MSWQVISSSVTGTRNAELRKVCQDYTAHKILDNTHTVIGAVSDGMGSAKHSEFGSKLAIEITITELEREGVKVDLSNKNNLRNLFLSISKTIRDELTREALKHNCLTQDLACTLIAFIATPNSLAAMQIGDGLIVIRTQEDDYKLLFQPDKGEYENETTSIVSPNALDDMQLFSQVASYSFICVATDGVENIALSRSKQNWRPFRNFFLPLETHMLSSKDLAQKTMEVSDFLNSKKVNQKTNDDKTLLICAYR